MDGGDQESDGELLAETDEITYECAPRQKHPVLFDEPVAIYVITYGNFYVHNWDINFNICLGKSMVCGMC